MAGDLSGAASLDKAIQEEIKLGGMGLPPIVQGEFPNNVQTLLNTPLLQMKSWLVLVRAAREMMQHNRLQDEFTDPKSYLRKWVGL